MTAYVGVVCAMLTLAAGGVTMAAATVETSTIDAAAHGTYVAAINSNNIETLMADLTDDVVYQSPNEPEIVGKAAVRKWAAAYLAADKTVWKKTSIGFTVSGDWAFERYTYKSMDTDRKTGAVATDIGKGINIFHHDADGKWRVARDGWSSSLPIAK